MNKIVLTGRVTADATITPGETPEKKKAVYSTAVNRPGKNNDADFFYCVAWGTRADFIEKGFAEGRFRKGCEVELEGQVHINTYKDRNGVERTSVQVDINSCHSQKHPSFMNNNAPTYGENGCQQQNQGGYNSSPVPDVPQDGFTPAPNAPQNGGYAPAPSMPHGNYASTRNVPQGGYAPAPNMPHGSYAPTRNVPQGGYAPAPNMPHGSYVPAPNIPQGGYPAASNKSQGNCASAPNVPQGSYYA